MAAALTAPTPATDAALLTDDPEALLWASSHLVKAVAQNAPSARTERTGRAAVVGHEACP